MLDISTSDIIYLVSVSLLLIYIGYISSKSTKYKSEYKYDQKSLDDAITKSLDRQRHLIKGILGEKLFPHMKEFLDKYEPADALFVGGKPIDYIIFKGYSREYKTDNPIDEIVFLEVKTSIKKKLSPSKNEAKIRDAINDNPPRVKYDLITIQTKE